MAAARRIRELIDRAWAFVLPRLRRWRAGISADLALAKHAGPKRGIPNFLTARWPEVSGALMLLTVCTVAAWPRGVNAPPPIMFVPMVAASAAAPPAAAVPAVQRQGAVDDPVAKQLRALGHELKARGATIENPQLLGTFFSRLDALDGPVVVAALGNSLIAGDGVVDILRSRLVARFGDSGRGLVLADRMASYGGRQRTAARAWGWKASTFAPPYKYRWPFGLTGVHHTAEYGGATSVFKLASEARADIFWLDRQEAAPVEVRIDGAAVATLAPEHSPRGRRDTVFLPDGAHELSLVAKGRGAVIQGVALEKAEPGVTLDMLGVPSADASIFLEADVTMFSDQLAARRPALVMLMFGGNETKRIAWHRSTTEKIDRDLRLLIRRVRAAANTTCWVVGPLDAVVKRGSNLYVQRPDLDEVIDIERHVASEEGCAFTDLFQAMGGTGSIRRFDDKGLMHPDRVHPKGKGLDLLGQMLSDALFDAYTGVTVPAPVAQQ